MSKISGLALVATGLVCMACSAAFADESDAAARGALYTQSVVCIPAKLIALDESARKGLVLDLDKAATQLGAGTDERAYKFPDSDVKVVFTLKYSAKQIEVSTLFSRVVNKIESKPKGKSKEKGKANVKAVEKEEILIPATLSPWNIDLPMQADTTQLLRAGEPDGVIPAFELACKLERRRIDNDCPECR